MNIIAQQVFVSFQKFPSKYGSSKNSQDATGAEASHLVRHNLVDLGAGFASYSRGQRSRGQGRGHSRGGRSQGRVNNSIFGSRKKVTATSSRRLRQVVGWKGKARGRGRNRARRSSQQKPAAKVHENDAPKEESAGAFVREETNKAETIGFQMEAARNDSSSGRSNYEDNYQATGDEYDFLVENKEGGYGGEFSGKSENILGGSDFNMLGEEDEDIVEDEDNGQVDVDVEDFINGDSDLGENGEDAEQSMDHDGLDTASSEFSD